MTQEKEKGATGRWRPSEIGFQEQPQHSANQPKPQARVKIFCAACRDPQTWQIAIAFAVLIETIFVGMMR
jgi:hypothetical protein